MAYPSEFLPSEAVYAITTDARRFYRVETASSQGNYTILGVAPGDYYVLALARWVDYVPPASSARTHPAAEFQAAYTNEVPCGEVVTCRNHDLIKVRVRAGLETRNIDPVDWYGGSYGRLPDAAPKESLAVTILPSYPSALDLAIYQGRSMGARYVTSQSSCRINQACFWFVSVHTGTKGHYYIASIGSNRDLLTCAYYAMQQGVRWRDFDQRCGIGHAFPTVGQTGRVRLLMGQTSGCVRVHVTPSLSGRVVGCLGAGTLVSIDDGPFFVPPSKPDAPFTFTDCWWHLAGRGWMVHQYL